MKKNDFLNQILKLKSIKAQAKDEVSEEHFINYYRSKFEGMKLIKKTVSSQKLNSSEGKYFTDLIGIEWCENEEPILFKDCTFEDCVIVVLLRLSVLPIPVPIAFENCTFINTHIVRSYCMPQKRQPGWSDWDHVYIDYAANVSTRG